jgi:hypothetical protein
MIQGKAWESFCDKHFNKCPQLANDQYNSETKGSEQETLPKVIDTNNETDNEETIPQSTRLLRHNQFSLRYGFIGFLSISPVNVKGVIFLGQQNVCYHGYPVINTFL